MTGSGGRGLSHDELLQWLSDHIGDQVTVSVVAEESGPFVLAGAGELRHWSGDTPFVPVSGPRRDGNVGLYQVGGWSLDLTELGPSTAATITRLGQGTERVEILLAEEVSLEIVRRPG